MFTREFVCEDCGAEIFSISPIANDDSPVCCVCEWLRAVEDPVERQKLREFLARVSKNP